MIKRRKKKKHRLVGLVFLLFLFCLSFFLTLKYFSINVSNEEFIRILLSQENHHITKTSSNNIFTNMISFISKIDIKKPSSIIKNNYVYSDYSDNSSDDEGKSSSNSSYVKDPYPDKSYENPIVYIYNTHQLEEYSVSNIEPYNITPNVMMVSYILREKLNDRGIPSLVEENNVKEILNSNNWTYSASYKVSKLLMKDAYTKNPTLKYFVDVHRDSVNKSISTTTINNKSYAKILFIVGLDNKDYQKNLDLTTALNQMFENNYPGISRGIYKKSGSGVNGVYNQDFSPNTILIEVGGQENMIDEVFNTTEAIAHILGEYIKGENNEE